MKRLNKLACAIAALALVMTPSNSALAKFVGTAQGDKPWNVQVRPANANTKSTAVTITFIDSKGRPDVEVFTAPVGQISLHSGPIPKGTVRIIVEVDNPAGQSCSHRITQGDPSDPLDPLRLVEEVVDGDLRFVFDVI